MTSTRAFNGFSIPADWRTLRPDAPLILAGGIVVAACILMPLAGLALVIGCFVLWFAGIVINVFLGRFEGLLLWWAGAFPLGYYFVSFPREHAVLTLDRAVVFVTFLALILDNSGARMAVPKTLRQTGLVWLAFAAVAACTLANSPNPINGARILLDSLVLPFLLGWCVIARFDVRRWLPTIHTGVCVSSIISAAVAAAEIATGQDLLPLGTAATAYGGLVRPNGPFETDDNLALIGTISIFLLLFVRWAMGPTLSRSRRILHFIGLTAAIGMAVMPLFRSVLITLLVVLIIDTFWEKGTSGRAWRLGLIGGSIGLVVLLAAFAPDVFEDRSSAGNVYGRIAQFQQSLQVFKEHPLVGVGLSNFHDYVAGEIRYFATYNGVPSLDWPHDNLAQILTETGILGFVPYVLTQIFLFKSLGQLRGLSRSGPLAWKYCSYMFLAYWITGLTESSGYGPVNLWYVFAITIIYKYVLMEYDSVELSRDQAFEEEANAPAQTIAAGALR
jgi:O-antigen ligase